MGCIGTDHFRMFSFVLTLCIYIFLVFFLVCGLESTQLACRVQSKHAQVEVQYWGNPEVARLEGTPGPAILF